MNPELADILSRVEDSEAIERILSAVDEDIVDQSVQPEMVPLSELYNRYLSRRQNRSPATLSQYKRTLPYFIEFADKNGVQRSNGITVALVDSFVDELREEFDSDATIHTYTKNVRGWFRWLSKRGLCPEEVCNILSKDELGLTPTARDEALPSEEAVQVLGKLRKQRRGSRIHALLELLWNGGLRIGGVHSLDVKDFRPDENELRIRHRPETGTRLKNGTEDSDTSGDGERNIVLRNQASDAIELYVATGRPESTDEYGREPLFPTSQGRAARSTLRRWIYQGTSCRWAPKECGEETCDGDCDPDSNVCSYSYYPHAIRRGAIVHHLSGGLRPDLASERFDVSVTVIRRHYDPRTKRRRKEDRAEAVRSSW